jgi:hypothetical protein
VIIRRKHPENDLQQAIYDYLLAVLPPQDWLVYANPNASRRTAGERASNGVPGLTKGIPDLSILQHGGKMFYLEVKAAKGVLSDPQETIRNRLDRMLVPFAVVRSIEDVRVALRQWGIKTREI